MRKYNNTFVSKVFAFPRWLVTKPVRWFIFWLIFAPLVFFTDRYCSAWMQLVPAAVIVWLLVGGMLTRTYRERLLLGLFVFVVGACEAFASLVLHWYTYRLGTIPPWIPPGHALVFLTVMLGVEQVWVQKHAAFLRLVVTAATLLYGIVGILGPSTDFAGAAMGMVFLIWLWGTGDYRGRFYTLLAPWVWFIELSGVSLGAWHYNRIMPILHLSQGSPPSGVMGLYGFVDLMTFGLVALFMKHAKGRSGSSTELIPEAAQK